jgi:hypothetical protein
MTTPAPTLTATGTNGMNRNATLADRDEARRGDALRAHGASPSVVAELLAYGASAFDEQVLAEPPSLPVPDEPFVAVWDDYLAAAARIGVVSALRQRLVQLNCPVQSGMSERLDYQAATRRGVLAGDVHQGLELDRPDDVALLMHPTAAGRIPVIVASSRDSFVRLLQALTHRNEPVPIPDSMGACIIGGYNNWDRVRRLRAEWEAASPADPSDAAWERAFRALIPKKELYQDRFIVLSSGPYSATPADAIGVPRADWTRLSGIIRLEHESTHYFTRRIFGSMRNTVFDELCADYAGIVAAAGHFRPEWLLRFMGLEEPAHYRAGGRLENYRGLPALSVDAFAVLQRVVRAAVAQLAFLDATRRAAGSLAVPDVILALARVGLERLSADDGWRLLDTEIARIHEAADNERRRVAERPQPGR